MSAYQGMSYEVVVRLLVDGPYGLTPVEGVEYNQVAVSYRKTATSAFVAKTLPAEHWLDLGDGYYAMVFTEAEMSVIGSFYWKLTSPGYVNFNSAEGTFDVNFKPLSAIVAPGYCVISGNIVDLGAEPAQGVRVDFRPAKMPSVVGQSLVDGRTQITFPDVYGNFSVKLLQGKRVNVEILSQGLKHTITVPYQETADLVSLLPPILD